MVRQQEAHDLEADGSLTQQLEDSIGLLFSHPSTGGSDNVSKCKLEVGGGEVQECKVDVKEEEDPEAGAPAQSKKRRLMQGASTSEADFTSLFESIGNASASSLPHVTKQSPEKNATILERTRRLTALIRNRYPGWDEHQVRLACAALAIYRMRLVDMFIREHALLLWVIEGGQFMRAHNGQCYLYCDGAF